MVVHDVSVCIVRLIMEAPLGYVHSLQASPNGAFFPNPLRGQGTRLHLYVLYHSRTSLILKADSGPAGAGSDTSRDSWASVGEVALPSHRFLVLGSAFDKIAGPSRCPPTPAAAPLRAQARCTGWGSISGRKGSCPPPLLPSFLLLGESQGTY